MRAHDTVEHWLKELGDRIGTPLQLQNDGVCQLSWGDSGQSCTIESRDELVIFYAPLLAVKKEQQEHLFERALALNLHGSGTGGCTIALDRQGQVLVLSLVYPVEVLSSALFENMLGNFIATTERLRNELSAENRSDDIEASAGGDNNFGFLKV